MLSDKWIRPATDKSPIPLEIDLASYMSTGGGRFATGAKFDLIDKFFNKSNVIAVGTYTKEQMAAKFGMVSYGWSMKQLDYRDGTDDYAERVYVFNSCNFMITKDAKFVVKADGTRSIENYAIEAFTDSKHPDNFDFVSEGLSGIFGNAYLQPAIDPWNIGRTVGMKYIGTVPKTTYTEAKYTYDVLHENLGNGLNLSLALAKMDGVIQDLWDTGVTKLLDANNRPIIYGTVGDNTIFADIANTLTLYKPYFKNGVSVIGGAGKDTISGTDYNDNIIGGEDNDTLKGNKGDDTLNGGAGNDTINGGDGIDTLNGGNDNDILNGGLGRDRINGDDGDDTLYGGLGDYSDTLNGGSGNDSLYGEAGIDTLNGGDGHDNLFGGDGADVIIGGKGIDTLVGGLGNDKFVINNGDEGSTITDAEAGDRAVYNGVVIEGKAVYIGELAYKIGNIPNILIFQVFGHKPPISIGRLDF